jgi:hypothetical protein
VEDAFLLRLLFIAFGFLFYDKKIPDNKIAHCYNTGQSSELMIFWAEKIIRKGDTPSSKKQPVVYYEKIYLSAEILACHTFGCLAV